MECSPCTCLLVWAQVFPAGLDPWPTGSWCSRVTSWCLRGQALTKNRGFISLFSHLSHFHQISPLLGSLLWDINGFIVVVSSHCPQIPFCSPSFFPRSSECGRFLVCMFQWIYPSIHWFIAIISSLRGSTLWGRGKYKSLGPFFNNFIDIGSIHKKLSISNVYDLVRLEISMHRENHLCTIMPSITTEVLSAVFIYLLTYLCIHLLPIS